MILLLSQAITTQQYIAALGWTFPISITVPTSLLCILIHSLAKSTTWKCPNSSRRSRA
ncbi:hypothetical protein K474DRAFT_1659497 [Panus rudis PR-1116 ss-1]|nr:hypothetical protein K474DRAFT_1659497 [Panus rudis PR-1116 ss-1]